MSPRRVLFITLTAVCVLVAQSPAYHITRTFAVGGDGSWDYVVPAPPNHRVFVARQNRLMVIDEKDGKLLGEVPTINGAHGTAIAESTGHGFATSGNDQMVVMFDLKTYQPLSRIPAAEDADAILNTTSLPTASSRSTATPIPPLSSTPSPEHAS